MHWYAVLQDVVKVRHEMRHLPTWLFLKCVGGLFARETTQKKRSKNLVFLLPGFCEGSNELTLLARDLQHAGHRVVLPAIPSFRVVTLPQMIRQCAPLFREFLRKKERLLLIGHSEGALAALYLAAKFPEAVRGVILLGGPIRGSNLADLIACLPVVSRVLNVRHLMTSSRLLRFIAAHRPACPLIVVASARDGLAPLERCMFNGATTVLAHESHIALICKPSARARVVALVNHFRGR